MSDAYTDDTPLSQREDVDIVKVVRECVRDSREATSEWRDEARTNYDIVAGRQWEPEALAVLTQQNRVPLTFNRVGPLVDAVAGAQVNNRQETKFLPRTMDDNGKAELLAGVLSWVRDNCDAEDEESEAFRDSIVTGMGWTETRLSYDDDPEGRVVIERRDPLKMYWQPSGQKRNLRDARWIAHEEAFAYDVVVGMFPDARDKIDVMRGRVPGETNKRPVVHPVRDQYAEGADDDGLEAREDMVRVTHYQWCEPEDSVLFIDPATGQQGRMAPDEFAKAQKNATALGLPLARHVKQKRNVWWRVFVCGEELLAPPEKTPDPTGPSFAAITGKRDRNKGVFYGLVRPLVDPQRSANKWLSQAMHIINVNAKGGLIFERDAVDDPRTLEEDWAKTGAAIVLNSGGLAKIKERGIPQFPAGFDRLLQFAITAIPDVTGINREMLGTADRDQPGVLEAQRKQAAQAVLAPMFDALRLYYKTQGRMLLWFVKEYIPKEKMLRITTPDGSPRVIAMADIPDMMQYDIVVDEAPNSPNQKTETWAQMQPLLPALIKLGLPTPVWAELLRYSPLPESAVEKMIKGIEQHAQQQAQQPNPEMAKMQAEMQMKQQAAQIDAQAAQERAALDGQIAMHKAQAEAQARQAGMAADIEMMRAKAAAEIEIAQMKAQAEMAIAAMKARADVARADAEPAEVED